MVDLHVHILPGVDDGAQSLEESLQMARMAAASGVEVMAVTPHCNIPGMFDNYWDSSLKQRVEELQEAVKREGISLELCPGMEVFAMENLPELIRRKRLVSLNNGRYLLVEFAFEEPADWMGFWLDEVLKAGYTPLIAHPERYRCVMADPQNAYEWIRMGCALQVNKGSILGRFGRQEQRTAMLLLEHELAACVASDAHHTEFRTTHMTEVAEYLDEVFGEGCVQLLLEDNPRRILDSQTVILPEPRGFRRDRYW